MSETQALPRRSILPSFGRVRVFARDDRGVTAIEFGILALPFFTIIAAILQTAIMFLTSQVLDSAIEDASRRVRTGQAQHFSLTDFRDYMCDYTFGLIDCDAVLLRTEIITDFSDAVPLDPTDVETCSESDGTCTMKTDWEKFEPGTCRTVMQVSAFYRYPLFITLPYFNLKNQPDNYRLLSATRVFRNEPFDC